MLLKALDPVLNPHQLSCPADRCAGHQHHQFPQIGALRATKHAGDAEGTGADAARRICRRHDGTLAKADPSVRQRAELAFKIKTGLHTAFDQLFAGCSGRMAVSTESLPPQARASVEDGEWSDARRYCAQGRHQQQCGAGKICQRGPGRRAGCVRRTDLDPRSPATPMLVAFSEAKAPVLPDLHLHLNFGSRCGGSAMCCWFRWCAIVTGDSCHLGALRHCWPAAELRQYHRAAAFARRRRGIQDLLLIVAWREGADGTCCNLC